MYFCLENTRQILIFIMNSKNFIYHLIVYETSHHFSERNRSRVCKKSVNVFESYKVLVNLFSENVFRRSSHNIQIKDEHIIDSALFYNL